MEVTYEVERGKINEQNVEESFKFESFKTLKDATFADGMAEVIKYGVIYDADLFEKLKNKNIDEEIIARCVEIKKEIVVEDEYENGIRKILNFGHTIGHAVEKCSNYKITHGSGVAIGMSMITKYAELNKLVSGDCYNRLNEILKLYNLPTKTDFTAEQLYRIATSDKKRDGDYISIVLPLEIGKCIVKKITLDELKEIIFSTMWKVNFMDITIKKRKLNDITFAPPSKSVYHRALICAALSGKKVSITPLSASDDIIATVNCLKEIGVDIEQTDDGYVVNGSEFKKTASIDCRECGSTFRFMIPLCAALGIETYISGSDGLSKRPISPLDTILQTME